MFALKIIGSDYYNPKTPYTEEEMDNGFVTKDTERIAKYKHRGYAERVNRELGGGFEIVEF